MERWGHLPPTTPSYMLPKAWPRNVFADPSSNNLRAGASRCSGTKESFINNESDAHQRRLHTPISDAMKKAKAGDLHVAENHLAEDTPVMTFGRRIKRTGSDIRAISVRCPRVIRVRV